MSSLSIKVTIAGRTYPLTIDRNEEEVIRKAAAEINKNIDSLKSNYAVKDVQDLLAMTALQFATKNVDKCHYVLSALMPYLILIIIVINVGHHCPI